MDLKTIWPNTSIQFVCKIFLNCKLENSSFYTSYCTKHLSTCLIQVDKFLENRVSWFSYSKIFQNFTQIAVKKKKEKKKILAVWNAENSSPWFAADMGKVTPLSDMAVVYWQRYLTWHSVSVITTENPPVLIGSKYGQFFQLNLLLTKSDNPRYYSLTRSQTDKLVWHFR